MNINARSTIPSPIARRARTRRRRRQHTLGAIVYFRRPDPTLSGPARRRRPTAGAAQMTRPIQTSCTERAAGGISLYSSVLNLPNSVSVRVAQNWFKRFQSSNFDVKDKPCSGLSVTDKADAILEKLEQGHQIRSYDIAEELRIDHRTVLAHLKKKLDIQKARY
ncbi:hypothetical protein EVAR_102493_1 [Eumeta japonica]|uniref:Histone-lysine N-methyltransferase SETMAR n=1 Tax=Eumeta variegata TaxID=151549 RepID=A0A4C1ZK00_EUMVA|nr:hypothetical protein EVAR_102493_1 [Eumeta japonica]